MQQCVLSSRLSVDAMVKMEHLLQNLWKRWVKNVTSRNHDFILRESAGTQTRYRNIATHSSCEGMPCQGSKQKERSCNVCMNNETMDNKSCSCTKARSGECSLTGEV